MSIAFGSMVSLKQPCCEYEGQQASVWDETTTSNYNKEYRKMSRKIRIATCDIIITYIKWLHCILKLTSGVFGMANGNVTEKKCIKKDKVNIKCYYYQLFGIK